MKDENPTRDRRNLRSFRRFAALEGLEVLRADFGHYRFPMHAHDRDVIGLIAQGAHEVERRGDRTLAGEGSIVIMPRDCDHAGGGSGWHIMTLYLPDGLVGEAAEELTGPNKRHMPVNISRDSRLRQELLRIHRHFLELPMAEVDPLLQHERLLSVLGYILRRYGPAQEYRRTGKEPRAVRRVRDVLEARWDETVSLAELSAIAGLSPFRLARVFKSTTGLPPHAYQVRLRVGRAQSLLRSGLPIAEVAQICGFADQSHLTRVFKRHFGFTPGQFRLG